MYNIYGHLLRHLGPKPAGLICALLYAALLLLILNYLFEPQAEFNYLNL